MAMKRITIKIGVFFVVTCICITSHFSGWKDICQSDSHLSRLLRSSWSLSQSEKLWIVKKSIICKEPYSAIRDVFRKVIYINMINEK